MTANWSSTVFKDDLFKCSCYALSDDSISTISTQLRIDIEFTSLRHGSQLSSQTPKGTKTECITKLCVRLESTLLVNG